MPGLVAAAGVLLVQLVIVAVAGTDIPFQDQWDAEGRGLYPALVDGAAVGERLFAPHNEHRIVWTQVLNAVLFEINGQWDPLVQLAAGAALHAGVTGLLAAILARSLVGASRWLAALGCALASMPFAAWHNALWGFQTQVYWVILWGVLACACWAVTPISPRRLLAGGGAMLAAMFAMGAGLLLPAALAMGVVWGGWRERTGRGALVVLGFGVALLLSHEVAAHAPLRAHTLGEWIDAVLQLLAWPLPEEPGAALVFNLPLLAVLVLRASGQVAPLAGERFAGLLAVWVLGVCGVLAWSRGGSVEFAAGVPSRYVDFVAVLSGLNAWASLALGARVGPRWRMLALAWASVWLLAWIGASAAAGRGVLYPRSLDRDAPVRLARQFQVAGDPAIFEGQPRLLVPHPDLPSVRAVLLDPRLQGRLPPSLQPEQKPGPLSRVVRWLFGRSGEGGAEPPPQ